MIVYTNHAISMTEQIKQLIELLLPVCASWIQKGTDGLERFVDPIDNEEISAHYGATHAAAAFIIWGKSTSNEPLYKQGLSLLQSILVRWNDSKKLPAFHADFNNLAVSMIEPFVDDEIAQTIRNIICDTEDSNHYTVNWLPMRWAVNKKRIEWKGDDNKYQRTIIKCKKIISKAINADGGIEDRLPYGISFNLQYDLATVAILQYLRVQGETIDLSKELGFLLNAMAPDGDINYQGRGTNQIFAWGLWVYLLASSGNAKNLSMALKFLEPRLKRMLDNNNMILNEWEGKEKYLWWDYHYASVYTAHCLLWLVMAYIDVDKARIAPVFPSTTETGLHIYRSENFFVSWFEGRTEYLAERGPAIAAIWTRKQGMICKGTFAPWQGSFGNKYIYEDVVLKNFCGLLEVKSNKDWSKNRYVHKLLPNLGNEVFCSFKAVFCPISVCENDGAAEITWNYDGSSELIFNFPTISENCMIKLFADGNEVSLFCNSAIKNQYGWMYLHQSRNLKCKQVITVIQ